MLQIYYFFCHKNTKTLKPTKINNIRILIAMEIITVYFVSSKVAKFYNKVNCYSTIQSFLIQLICESVANYYLKFSIKIFVIFVSASVYHERNNLCK